MKGENKKTPVGPQLAQDKSIDEVGWPPSIVRALSGAYYQTLEDVAVATDYELIVLPRIGPRCLRLIDMQLTANGYQRERGVDPDLPYEAALGQKPKMEPQRPRRPWGVPKKQAEGMGGRSCAHCQTLFVGTWEHQKYCSRYCAGAARRKQQLPPGPRHCPHCNTLFTPQYKYYVQQYCSISCARRVHAAPPERLERILYLRYEQGMTLKQIGTALEITRERVRQILASHEKGSLRKSDGRSCAASTMMALT